MRTGSTCTFRRLHRGLLLALFAMAPVASMAAVISFDGVVGGVFSTGLSSSGSALTGGAVDPHYALIDLPDGCSGLPCSESGLPGDPFGPSTYVVLGPNGTFPITSGGWLANDASSLWIGPRADQTNPVVGGTTFPDVGVFASDTDFYAYRIVFNLGSLGIIATTANLQLAWASDAGSAASIRLCPVTSITDPICGIGSTVQNSGNSGPGALTGVSLVHGQDGTNFSSGLNALDFIVYNTVTATGTLNPSGLRVDIVSATGSNTPVDPTPTPVPEPGSLALMALAALAAVGLSKRAARR